MAAFTARELDIMVVLWEHGPSTVAEVRAKLEDRLSHNTVATLLTIPENKGRVDHVEGGPRDSGIGRASGVRRPRAERIVTNRRHAVRRLRLTESRW